MTLTCKDLMKDGSFENIQLVAGEKGISNAITWIYIKQTESLIGWLNGGEIIFIVEKTAGRDNEYFEKIIAEGVKLNAAALVFLIGGDDYIESIPRPITKLADKNCLPLFVMNYKTRIVDVTREISNVIFTWNYKNRQVENYLLDLLHSDGTIGNAIGGDGEIFGFNFKRPYFIAAICDKDILKLEKKSEFDITNRCNCLGIKLKAEAEKKGESGNFVFTCGLLVMYFSCEDQEKRTVLEKHICKAIKEYNLITENGMMAGFSLMYTDMTDMSKAYEEARKTLRFTLKNGYGRVCCAYEDMGILRFLLAQKDREDVLMYCNEVLRDIWTLEKKDKIEYTKTLWVYLKMNSNMVQTATALFIHRNTLMNRINKIQMITGKDLANPYVRQEYMNAFMILDYLGKI